MLSNEIKEQIAHEVIRTLYSRFENFPENANDNRNAPFHEAFLNAFSEKLANHVTDIPYFISLASWLHGLNTTLGQSFFENVANILSNGYKKPFTVKYNSLLKIHSHQKQQISEIITNLKNANLTPNLNDENNLLFDNELSPNIDANNFTVDVFYESDEEIIAIELKSVRPNAGEMRGEKQKILEAKSALFFEYPDKTIKYYIGFPFDPTSEVDIEYDKTRFLNYLIDGNKYFAHDEVLLSNELWDYLSDDTNTMKQILYIINSIATPQFMNYYNLINNFNNIENETDEYLRILENWYQFNEKKIVQNYSKIKDIIEDNSRLNRKFKQPLFKKDKYNVSRKDALLRFIINYKEQP